MKIGDIVIAINDEGRYVKGTEMIVIGMVSSLHDKPIRVRNGQLEAWYAEKDLKLKMI